METEAQRYRLLAKRYNERVLLIAATLNTSALGALGAAVLVPMIETSSFVAALTPLNGVIALWCVLVHLMAQTAIGFCVAEDL
jgi:hypothetical protein